MYCYSVFSVPMCEVNLHTSAKGTGSMYMYVNMYIVCIITLNAQFVGKHFAIDCEHSV